MVLEIAILKITHVGSFTLYGDPAIVNCDGPDWCSLFSYQEAFSLT